MGLMEYLHTSVLTGPGHCAFWASNVSLICVRTGFENKMSLCWPFAFDVLQPLEILE